MKKLIFAFAFMTTLAQAAPPSHSFTLTAQQEAILVAQAQKAGVTVDEFIDANCIQKFIAEIVNREIQDESRMVKGDFERATDDQKARIKTILSEGR